MRGSRTLNMPLATRRRSLVRLTRSIACRVRRDHPSVTLALIPSALIRKRTALIERPRRWAIFLTGSYPAQFNSRSSSAGVQGWGAAPRAEPDFRALETLSRGWCCSKPASSGVLRKWRIRRQQSPRVSSGTCSRILLIASRFAAGPSLIPAINKRSTTANHLELILAGLPFCRGAPRFAQPHHRKIGVVSLLPATRRSSPVARLSHGQYRAKLAVAVSAVPRLWYKTFALDGGRSAGNYSSLNKGTSARRKYQRKFNYTCSTLQLRGGD